MKKLMTGILLIVSLVLVGCATDHYPQYMEQAQKTDTANAQLVGVYFASQASRDAVVLANLKDPTSLVLYGMLQGQRDAALVAQFKGSAIKAPTTGMDLWNTALGNTIPTIIRWGAGYLMAGDLLDALGAGMSVGGDYTSFNASAGNDFTGDINFTPNTSRTWTDSFNSDFRRDYVDNTDNSVRPPETTFP